MIFTYEVKATGLGHGYNRYSLDFEFMSNLDIKSKNYGEQARLMDNIGHELIRRGFPHYFLHSVKKIF